MSWYSVAPVPWRQRRWPWGHAHGSSWSLEKQKREIGKKVKSNYVLGNRDHGFPVLLFQELDDKYKNCRNFKSQNRSRLTGTSADNARKWSPSFPELVYSSVPGRTATQGANDTSWIEVIIWTAGSLLWLLSIWFSWRDCLRPMPLKAPSCRRTEYQSQVPPSQVVKRIGEKCCHVLLTHTHTVILQLPVS